MFDKFLFTKGNALLSASPTSSDANTTSLLAKNK